MKNLQQVLDLVEISRQNFLEKLSDLRQEFIIETNPFKKNQLHLQAEKLYQQSPLLIETFIDEQNFSHRKKCFSHRKK